MPPSVYDASEVVEMPKNLRTITVSPPGSPESTSSTSSAVAVAAVVVPPDIPRTPLQGKNPLKPVELTAAEIPSTKPSVSASVPISLRLTEFEAAV